MTDIRLPSIRGTTEKEQLFEIKNYLCQLATELQFAMAETEEKMTAAEKTVKQKKAADSTENAVASFNEIKSLIIKSADIVNAYYGEISKKIAGEYVAKSDFGTFSEKVNATFLENAKGTEQIYDNLQKVESKTEKIEYDMIDVHANIKTGLLYYDDAGAPVYGLEIGQRTVTGNTETFRKFARFTADRLSFYDQNDREVAYISDYKLHITRAEVAGELAIGRYQIETENGLLFKYK